MVVRVLMCGMNRHIVRMTWLVQYSENSLNTHHPYRKVSVSSFFPSLELFKRVDDIHKLLEAKHESRHQEVVEAQANPGW